MKFSARFPSSLETGQYCLLKVILAAGSSSPDSSNVSSLRFYAFRSFALNDVTLSSPSKSVSLNKVCLFARFSILTLSGRFT